MVLATILLSLAALGGLTMAVFRMQGNPRPPNWIPPVHGLVAASGVALLIVEAATNGIPRLVQVALGLFVIAAGGGLFMNLQFHRQNRALPIPVMLGHGLLALTGVLLLILCVTGTVGTAAVTP